MSTSPDLIVTSGREDMQPEERLALLAHDAKWLSGMEPQGPSRRGAGDEIHDLRCLQYVIEGDAQFRAKFPQALDLAWVSRIECRVLAWRRGGFREHTRVHREQIARQRGAT